MIIFRMKSVCALIKRDWLLVWRVTKKGLYRLNRLGKIFFSRKCYVSVYGKGDNMQSTFTFTYCIYYVFLCPKFKRCVGLFYGRRDWNLMMLSGKTSWFYYHIDLSFLKLFHKQTTNLFCNLLLTYSRGQQTFFVHDTN